MLLIGVCVIIVYPIAEMQWEKMKPKFQKMYESDQRKKQKVRDKRESDHDMAIQ